MELISLASGSSGNCFYIENKNQAILIDAGISAKQITHKLMLKNKSPENIRGIFITHEHSDHTKGADVFARKYKIPIYATKKTISSSFLCSNSFLLNTISPKETIFCAGLSIEPLSKSHSAADPIFFNIYTNKKLSIITDLGYVCKNVVSAISDSDAICLESNHDVRMLNTGPYPYYLKKWILSDLGHLSNTQAALALLQFAPSKLKTILLSHLSETNNTPNLAFNTISSILKERTDLKPEIFVLPRHEISQTFSI